jgi:leucyl aminopeptidase
VALGSRIPGVMGSDEFRDRVAEISQRVGENGWPMPLPDELKEDLKSTVADLANVSGQRFAGMLVAGVYLSEFVADGVAWVHLDVAGPAYNTGSAWGYTPKGATGVPARTMFAVLADIAEQG